MRMWLVNPEWLCRKHLLGEHVELHMLLGSIEKDKNLTGFIDGGLIDASQLPSRHTELVEEMERRGYNHNSPIDLTEKAFKYIISAVGKIDIHKSIWDLQSRCSECKNNMGEGIVL